jgi:hypothetical protein
MFLNAKFLKTNVVLEHFAEVDSHTLADSTVDGVINIQFFQGVVTGVQYGKNTDDTVMLNFVVSQIHRHHLFM